MRRDDTRQEDETGGESQLSPGDLVAMLRRRLRLIAAATLLATLAAVSMVLVWPNRYEAIAVIQLDPRPKTVTKFENVYEDLKADTPTIESEAEIAISGPVLRDVMMRLDLLDDPELTVQASVLDEVRRRLGIAVPAAAPPAARPRTQPVAATRPGDFEQLSGARKPSAGLEREPALAAFNDRVSARRLRNTQLIEIRYSSRDPVKAARVATAIAESYILAQINAKREGAEVANAQIEKRIVELKGGLADHERAIETLRTELGVYQADGGQLSERQLSRQMEGVIEARRRTADAAARYEEARRALATGPGRDAMQTAAVPEMFRSNSLRTLAEALEKAERRRDDLRQKYGPLHPERQRGEAEAETARTGLVAELANIVATARSELAIAEESERHLDQRLVALKSEVGRTKEREWQLKALEREAKSSREVYEHLLSRRKQTAESAELQIADARVIDRAMVPLRPASPKRKQIVLIALIGGLLAGLGMALALELMQPGIASPAHAERDIDLTLIAAIPRLAHARATHTIGQDHVRADPQGAFAEAVREIRHALDDGRPPGRQLTVLLASALPGEGKSLVALNLAATYAMTPGRVLLMDADLRRGNLTRQRQTSARGGLADILAGRAVLDDCVRQDGLDGSWFLGCGGTPDSGVPAAELLASPAMGELMARLAREFDTIIIDAPPVLPVIDARVLAQFADDIVFVAAVRRTPKDQVRRAMRMLGQNAQKVLGVVINGVDGTDRYQTPPYTRQSSAAEWKAA